jgi:hypothetical protein
MTSTQLPFGIDDLLRRVPMISRSTIWRCIQLHFMAMSTLTEKLYDDAPRLLERPADRNNPSRAR